MRRSAKIDDNHGEIVRALREAGCTVQSLAAMGKGVPDLLVGVRGFNLLMEIKDGDKPKSAQKLTKDEFEWHAKWRGSVLIIYSVDQAIKIINRIRDKRG